MKSVQLSFFEELLHNSRHVTLYSNSDVTITTPDNVMQWARDLGLDTAEQEEFHLICVGARNNVLATVMLYRGTTNSTNVRIAEVFREAVRLNAMAIVVVHNHPSGDPEPSLQDEALTRQLVEAGNILGITLFDHIVVGKGRYQSMAKRGLIQTR